MKRIVKLLLMAVCMVPVWLQAKEKKEPKVLIELSSDSVITDFNYADVDSLHVWQKSVTIEKDGVFKMFDPEGVKGFIRKGKHFYSRMLTLPDGTTVRRFLHRIAGKDEGPSIYAYYLPAKGSKPYYYFEETQGCKLELVDPQSDMEHPDALHQYLLMRNKAAGGDADIADYLCKLRPNKDIFDLPVEIIRKQNCNLIPRIRYGVGIGVNTECLDVTFCDFYNEQEHTSYEYGIEPSVKNQMSASLFADIPIAAGFSFHPELTYRKTSMKGYDQGHLHTEFAFNRSQFSLPLMGRYTFVHLRGNFLPYVDLGMNMDFFTTNSADYKDIMMDEDGYVENISIYSTEDKSFSFGGIGGLGLEYKLNQRHSLFFDVHYVSNFKMNEVFDSYLNINHTCFITRLYINL